MRIFFLPVTAQRSSIYCQKIELPLVKAKPRLDDRLASKAAKVWDGFEKSDKKWKQLIVRWTGKSLDTIPFEEGGLKTVPPPNTMMRQLKDKSHISEKEASAKGLAGELEPIPLVFPSTAFSATNPMTFEDAQSRVNKIAINASKTHRKQMIMCVAGLPSTIPFAINPFFPNVPGFYSIYRLWCNYRAYKSAQHSQFLIKNKHFVGINSPEIDSAYKDSPIPMSSALAHKIDVIIGDRLAHRELQQAVRQTSVSSPKNKHE